MTSAGFPARKTELGQPPTEKVVVAITRHFPLAEK